MSLLMPLAPLSPICQQLLVQVPDTLGRTVDKLRHNVEIMRSVVGFTDAEQIRRQGRVDAVVCCCTARGGGQLPSGGLPAAGWASTACLGCQRLRGCEMCKPKVPEQEAALARQPEGHSVANHVPSAAGSL